MRLGATALVLSAALLGGCAVVNVEVRRKPMQDEILQRVEEVQGAQYGIYRDQAGTGREFTVLPIWDGASETAEAQRQGWRVYRWPTMERVLPTDFGAYPVGDLVPEPALGGPARIREAVKVSRWFWGILSRATTPPVRYDEYEPKWRDDLGWWTALTPLIPELSRDEFFVTQANGKRAPLEADLHAPTKMLFRLLTLGVFWDSGYTIDEEEWGLHNAAKAWGWLGKGRYVLVQDKFDLQFKVKSLSFDPTQTVATMGNIVQEAATAALASKVPLLNKNGLPYDSETDENRDVFYARLKTLKDERDEKSKGLGDVATTAAKNQKILLDYRKALVALRAAGTTNIDCFKRTGAPTTGCSQ